MRRWLRIAEQRAPRQGKEGNVMSPQVEDALCRPLREQLIANAIDDLSVAQAASEGVLPALRLVLARCEELGVEEPTLAEVMASWADVMG